MNVRYTALALAATALLTAGCANREEATPPNVLVAARVATPPVLDGDASDAAWAAAKAIKVELTGGMNFANGKGETLATLKAVYSGDTVYFLVQYADPTNSLRRGPYQKQADGSWKKLKDPADKGGDDNVYYEDKWAMIWNINNSMVNFDKKGCAVACHLGEGKPYGNKYLASEGQLGDMWHMKGSRTAPLGKVDDQYLNHARHDPKTNPNAGRKSDPGGPEYKGFDLVAGKPPFMNPDARPLNAGGKAYIVDGSQVAFDDSKFKPGDEVASYLVFPLKTDRADINVALRWAQGMHTSEVSRKLVTGSKFDVQFADLDARYGFGFAAFDNAQVQHATGDEPLYLRFGK
ncbi:Ethylbenzene dehydrogenase [Rubrivivax sp. A210]|uniref:ethylbenzene dehydrogenase-related protein n=1 Tax=Rubrivivax sp. A210 TaxID=2772301 RepID=UPI00191A22D0|nr:ethylbenzene dehydrogenase-related protein [Rubrivivax sp. A210]CAD5372982.1 Ethylbenzene dehydrogenase [Rubrivivax sp. A210]